MDTEHDRQSRLAAIAPAPLVRKLREAPVTGERKPVTLLFADVAGSTTLAESMDSEDWAEIIHGAFERMGDAIYLYEGTVAQLQGDGLLAFFGAPIAHEDDPVRAVRAALDMVGAVERYGRQLEERLGLQFRIRVGINTGRVVVGDIGTDLRYEYTAVGDAVNVAARMQTTSDPGSVVVTAATWELVKHVFEATDLGPLIVKGKTEPVHAYRVVGVAAVPGSGRGLPDLTSALVGRDRELDALTETFEVVRAGQGRVACVVGEAGVGKSRLLAAFRDRLAESPGASEWTEARSISYGLTLPYHVLAGLVHSLIGATMLTPPEEIRERLRRSLRHRFGDEADDVVPYLEHLLGVPVSAVTGAEPDQHDPHLLLDRYVTSLGRVLRADGPDRRRVVVCEDLHWADAASAEALGRLIPMLSASGVMVIVTARMDRDAPGWRTITAARELYGDALLELRLEPLDEGLSRRLVANLLAIESLPASVRELILARGAGNPFFIEEVIRSLIDRGAVVPRDDRWVADPTITDVEVPRTLEGLLQARIDRLPADARAVMRLAAVFIRDISVARLERLAAERELRVDVREQLDRLEALGILRVSATRPELAYTFRHALLHDAAYESLLKAERRGLHRRVAELIEELEPERRDELAPVLAEHFDRAGDGARALPYQLAAGRQALTRFANHEARRFFERAEALLSESEADDPATARRRVEAAIGRVQAGWTFMPMDEDLAHLQRIEPLAESLGDPQLLIQTHYWLAFVHRLRGDRHDSSPELRRSLERVAELSRGAGDDALRGLPLALLGDLAVFSGRFRDGVELLEEALPLLERRHDFNGASEAVWALGYAHASLGDFTKAREVMSRAASYAEQGDPVARLALKLLAAFVEAIAGNVEASVAAADACAAESMELGHQVCAIGAAFMMGSGYLRLGKPELAIPALERSIELSRHSSLFTYRFGSQAFLAAARAARGEVDVAETMWADALAGARSIGDRAGEGQILLVRGTTRTGLGPGHVAAALDDLETAQRIFEELEARPLLVEALRAHGRALETAGRTQEARDQLDRAQALGQQLEAQLLGWSPSGLPTLRRPMGP